MTEIFTLSSISPVNLLLWRRLILTNVSASPEDLRHFCFTFDLSCKVTSGNSALLHTPAAQRLDHRPRRCNRSSSECQTAQRLCLCILTHIYIHSLPLIPAIPNGGVNPERDASSSQGHMKDRQPLTPTGNLE